MNFKHTVYTFIVLLGITAGYLIVRAVLTPETTETFSLYGKDYSNNDVVGIDFTTGTSSQSVIFKGGRYWILNKKTGEYSIPARKKQMHSFFGGLEATDLINKISREEKDLSEWDLGKKAQKLVLTYGDGSSREIFIGADNPVGRGVFITIGTDKDTVYMVSKKLHIASEAILFQLIEDRILLADPSDIQGFTIDGKKTKEWKENQVGCTRMGDKRWQITFPITKDADTKAVKTYLEVLNTFRFESLFGQVYEFTGKEEKLLSFSAELEEGKKETLEFYKGGSDVMGQGRYIMINRRTGLAGYVYPPVFNAVNKSFISFIWRRLFRGDPRNVKKVQVKKGTRTVTFVHKESGEWTVSEYFDAPADPRIMTAVLDALMNFRVSEYVTDKVEELEGLGLKYPAAMLTIEEKEGENSRSYCYYFGKQVKGADEIYFKEVDANEVYTVKYDFIRLLSRPAPFYAMRRVNNIKKELIEWVKIIRRDRAYKFRSSDTEGWYLKEPLLTKHINGKLMRRLFAMLEEMEFVDIPVQETVPKDVFDDANTDMTLSLKTRAPARPNLEKSLWPESEKDILILISRKKDSSGNIYAKRKFTNLTFTLKPSVVDFFRQEFVDTSVLIDDMSTAIYLKLTYRGGSKVVIEKKGVSWNITEPAGKAVDEKAVLSYINILNSLKGNHIFMYRTDEAKRKELGFADPLLSVELSKGMDTKYGFSLADHPKNSSSGLAKRMKDIYILQITAADKTRIHVQPEYFMLEEEK